METKKKISSFLFFLIILFSCNSKKNNESFVEYLNENNEVVCKGKIDFKNNKNNWFYISEKNKIVISWLLKKHKKFIFYLPKNSISNFKNIVIFDMYFKEKKTEFQFFFIQNELNYNHNLAEVEEFVLNDIEKKDSKLLLEKRFRIKNYSFSQYEIWNDNELKKIKLISLIKIVGTQTFESRVYYNSEREKLVKIICFDMLINILHNNRNLYNYKIINKLLQTKISEINMTTNNF